MNFCIVHGHGQVHIRVGAAGDDAFDIDALFEGNGDGPDISVVGGVGVGQVDEQAVIPIPFHGMEPRLVSLSSLIRILVFIRCKKILPAKL